MATPAPSRPAVEPSHPTAVPAAAPAAPAPSPTEAEPEAEAEPAGPPRRSRLPLLVTGVALALVAVLAAVLLSKGGNDGEDEAVLPPEVPTYDLGIYSESIAVDDGTVWLGADDATVARFGVAETRVTGTIRVGSGEERVRLAVGAGAVWVADPDAGTVSRIDPGTNTVTARLEVGTKPHSVIVAAGAVWVTIEEDGVVVRIDPATRAMTRIHVRGSPTFLAYGAGTLWVTDTAASNLVRIDTMSNTVVGDGQAGECPGRIVADETTVWVEDACESSTMFQIDPSTGKVLGTAAVGEDTRGLALAKGSLWVANSSDGTVSQVDARTRQVQRTIRVGSDPIDLAADSDSIWVANGDATLSRIPL